MKFNLVIRSVVLGVLVSLPVTVMAETDHMAIEKMVSEMAEKPQHHQAIADYYKGKAEEAKQAAEQHRSMKNAYLGSGKNQGAYQGMRNHCEKLIKAYESAAFEYEQLAKEHESAAAKAE